MFWTWDDRVTNAPLTLNDTCNNCETKVRYNVLRRPEIYVWWSRSSLSDPNAWMLVANKQYLALADTCSVQWYISGRWTLVGFKDTFDVSGHMLVSWIHWVWWTLVVSMIHLRLEDTCWLQGFGVGGHMLASRIWGWRTHLRFNDTFEFGGHKLGLITHLRLADTSWLQGYIWC